MKRNKLIKRKCEKLLLKSKNNSCERRVKQESLDSLIFDICDELTQEDLFRLGIKGFGLSFVQVKRAKDDAKSTLEAAINVFHDWRQNTLCKQKHGISNDSIYSKENLKAALKNANFNYLATKYFTAET